jgi:CheY-like chemotaxis protein
MQSISSKNTGKVTLAGTKLDKVHVLLLDNSTHVTELFKKMLNEFGFTNVFVANNGFQGVQILREVKINLIITDWDLKLPVRSNEASNVISHKEILPLSGVDFVRRLRQSPTSPNPIIPIIMFADTVEEIQVKSARDAGVDEICIKPLSAEELCKRIVAVIEKPRIFVTAKTFKGPCRRQKKIALPPHQKDKRKCEIRIVKYNEKVGGMQR